MKPLRKSRISRISRAAFSLIEVTLALGIAAFCMITVFALLPMGLNTSQNASEQTVVAGIATAISADFHGATSLSGTTSRFQFFIPGANQPLSRPQVLYFAADGSPSKVNGTVVGNPVTGIGQSDSPTAESRYRATVTINPDPTLYKVNNSTPLYKVWILVTWPALADPNQDGENALPSNFAGSFETVTALNYYSN